MCIELRIYYNYKRHPNFYYSKKRNMGITRHYKLANNIFIYLNVDSSQLECIRSRSVKLLIHSFRSRRFIPLISHSVPLFICRIFRHKERRNRIISPWREGCSWDAGGVAVRGSVLCFPNAQPLWSGTHQTFERTYDKVENKTFEYLFWGERNGGGGLGVILRSTSPDQIDLWFERPDPFAIFIRVFGALEARGS